MNRLHLKPKYWIGHPAYPRNGSNRFVVRGTRIGSIREIMQRGFSFEEAKSALDRVDEGSWIVLSHAGKLTEVQKAPSI